MPYCARASSTKSAGSFARRRKSSSSNMPSPKRRKNRGMPFSKTLPRTDRRGAPGATTSNARPALRPFECRLRFQRTVYGALVGDLEEASALFAIKVSLEGDSPSIGRSFPPLFRIRHNQLRGFSRGGAGPRSVSAASSCDRRKAVPSLRCRHRARQARDRTGPAHCRSRPRSPARQPATDEDRQ